MLNTLPASIEEFMEWPWERIAPYYQELIDRPLDSRNGKAWLEDWTGLSNRIQETFSRLTVATTVDTTDKDADQRFKRFLDEVFPTSQAMEQKLKEKLLASGLEPDGFEVPLRNLRAESELFREANLPLQSEEMKLGKEYNQIIGAQTVEWDGQELTLSQLRPVYTETDRHRREKAWRLATGRQLADREAINALWQKLLPIRQQIAANAGEPDYRAYRWKEMLRFDYSPEDALSFHRAIEEVVVPAAEKIYARRQQRLGVDSLRPWDLDVDPMGRPPLRPFSGDVELKKNVGDVFKQVDPQLGQYFSVMQREGLLDLENRKGKAPGGYCADFPVAKRPFIFMNAVGLHDDVQTLLHEGGHSFHVFETAHLPYAQQLQVPMEFAEVASMGMELLASPYLAESAGGFYNPAEAAKARVEHLEGSLLFWPYMAVVDAFQHWAYTHPEQAIDPKNCDAAWGREWDRFMHGVDWSGLEDAKVTGWHRKLHIFRYPFYYVEYGLAQLGAVQVWSNALDNQAEAVTNYRRALSLGGTATLPQLFETAGARFAFDASTLRKAVDLMMQTIEELDAQQEK